MPTADVHNENISFKIIKSGKPLHTFYSSPDQQLFILQSGWGLTTIVNDSLTLIKGGRFYENDLFVGILPFDENSLIFATRNRGLFIYDGEKSVPLKQRLMFG